MATTNSPDPSVLGTTAIDSKNPPSSAPPKSYTYYHAGPLFTIAELHTNVLLSRAINTHSSGKFVPILPQDLEQRDLSPHSIRDEDLRALLSCDLALFTYDGSELDAGTVVEYMVAKMADVPAVILRTDFRGAGDQAGKGDSWNLMSSNWPRSVGERVDDEEIV
jgi:nucleoside 2-deoxyribosyltransferase